MAKEPIQITLENPSDGAASLPPRQMLREDRRLIFAQLEDCYLDEKSGYVDGWSDEKVAKTLNVPRKWVEQIRDENFGPAINATEELRNKIREMTKTLSNLTNVIAQELSEIKDKSTKTRAVLKSVENDLNFYEEEEARLSAEVKRIQEQIDVHKAEQLGWV